MIEAAVSVEHLHHGVIDAVLETEEEVKVTEADVGVNGDGREAQTGEGEADIGCGGRFSDAALSGGDDHHSRRISG